MADTTDTPSVVVDASCILSRLLPDEKVKTRFSSYFQRFSHGSLIFIAPKLLRYEVANALRSATIQKRIDESIGEELLIEFLKLPILYLEDDVVDTYKVAIELNLSIYDAVYVWLAKKKHIPLLSLDENLSDAS